MSDITESPHVALHVIRGLITLARELDVTHISIDDLETAVNNTERKLLCPQSLHSPDTKLA